MSNSSALNVMNTDTRFLAEEYERLVSPHLRVAYDEAKKLGFGILFYTQISQEYSAYMFMENSGLVVSQLEDAPGMEIRPTNTAGKVVA
jgi:hypothetical protein